MPRQGWPYLRTPTNRAQAVVEFVDPQGMRGSKRMLVDTGFEYETVVEQAVANAMNHGAGPTIPSNYGPLIGYIMRVEVQNIGFSANTIGYTNSVVENILRSEGFEGMIGLAMLQTLMYGGNSAQFYLEH